MSRETEYIKEGYKKKGGQNQKPSTPRPSTPPLGQKPEPNFFSIRTIKGKEIEIPIHLVKIELHKGWGSEALVPQLILKMIPESKEELKKMTDLFAEMGFEFN